MDAPKTVEEIYEDFCGRRAALVAALTTGTFFVLFVQSPS